MNSVIIDSLESLQNEKVIKLLINYNLAKIGIGEKVDITPQDYSDFLKYKNLLDYNACYHAMKDFAEYDFSIEDIMDSGLEVSEMAARVRSMSVNNPEKIEKFIATPEGELLAYITYTLRVPLVDEAWKLTPLQVGYLNASRGEKIEGNFVAQEGNVEFTGREISQDDLDKNPDLAIERFLHRVRRSPKTDPKP